MRSLRDGGEAPSHINPPPSFLSERKTAYLSTYLPRYTRSADHSETDPDLYDTLVRKFQSPAEREAEGRARGWGKTLESSLMRGEDRLERLASSYTGDHPPTRRPNGGAAAGGGGGGSQGGPALSSITNFAIDADLADGKPATREEGRTAWEDFLRERFVRGGDEDFDYGQVDGDEDLDAMEDRDREEAYFDEMEPEWADDSDGLEEGQDEEGTGGGEHGGGPGGVKRPRRERMLLGQTGIQDY